MPSSSPPAPTANSPPPISLAQTQGDRIFRGAPAQSWKTPADTVACAIALAKCTGVLTILDPAPVSSEGLPESLYHVDILIPNQSEAAPLSGIAGARRTPDLRRPPRRGSRAFSLRATRMVIVKLGSAGGGDRGTAKIPARSGVDYPLAPPADAMLRPGVRFATRPSTFPDFAWPWWIPPPPATPFAGALCVGLAEGMPLALAVALPMRPGVACTKMECLARCRPGRKWIN